MSNPIFKQFVNTILSLEAMIEKLEINTGTKHKRSPFVKFLEECKK